MAASSESAEVQEYLEKHKIDGLFGELRKRVSKDLPVEPLSYLIAALRGIQEKRKRSPVSRDASHRQVQVVGRAITPKTSSERLNRSADNMRPSTTTGRQPTTPKRPPLQSASTSSVTGRPGSGKQQDAAIAMTTPTNKATPLVRPLTGTPRPATAPAKTARPAIKPPSKSANKSPSSSKIATKFSSQTTTTTNTAAKRLPGTTTKVTKSASKTDVKPKPPSAKEETIDEFFEGKKKSSLSLPAPVEQEDEDCIEPASSEAAELEEGVAAVTMLPAIATETDTQQGDPLLEAYYNRANKKPPSAARAEQLKSLLMSSEGDNGREEEEGDEEMEEESISLIEDVDQLIEEGVDPSSIKRAPGRRHQPASSTAVCARLVVDGAGQPVAMDTVASDVQEDFESVSQVGTATELNSFPQWQSSDTSGSLPSSETATMVSTVTEASRDEWAGLTQAHQFPAASDVESEVQIPQLPLTTGESWIPPTHESSTAQEWAT